MRAFDRSIFRILPGVVAALLIACATGPAVAAVGEDCDELLGGNCAEAQSSDRNGHSVPDGPATPDRTVSSEPTMMVWPEMQTRPPPAPSVGTVRSPSLQPPNRNDLLSDRARSPVPTNRNTALSQRAAQLQPAASQKQPSSAHQILRTRQDFRTLEDQAEINCIRNGPRVPMTHPLFGRCVGVVVEQYVYSSGRADLISYFESLIRPR